MIADSERREVARRLREVNPYRNQSYTVPYHRYTPASEYLSELAGTLGYSPKNDVNRLEFQNRLADLIEPSEPKVKCVAEVKIDGEQLEQLVHDAAVELTGIDRDAERTCRVESSHEVEGDGCYAYFEYELTCGHEMAWGYQLPPSYCPECGRKVLYDSDDYI